MEPYLQKLLGVITGTKADKRGEPVAWVKPLFEVGTWREVEPGEFPSRGSVFWPQAKDVIPNALVLVRIKENTVQQGFKDEFMVVEGHSALEALDFREIDNLEQIRALLHVGVAFSGILPTRYLIWCRDNVVVGPVGLVLGPNGTILEKNNRQRISCFHLKQG
jgi:hypothetical protein